MTVDTQEIDTGTGYGLAAPKIDPRLNSVGAGTPMGETLRRYWHPIALSSQATDVPRRVRLLAEDLILFRDGQGRPGLVAETCCHRGASLFYGRVDDEGIRCCYHGWQFDHKGRCLNQPFEPEGGLHRGAVRQPWYPVEELYGVVWAYMGPPEKKPVLPRWAALEIPDDSTDVVEVTLEPGWGDEDGMPFGWMHCYENSADPYHVPWLHALHSGRQFVFTEHLSDEQVRQTFDVGVKWEESALGLAQHTDMMSVEMIFPTITCVPGFNDVMIHVPVDDNHCRMIQFARVKQAGAMADRHISHGGKDWKDCTPEELQKYPGDGEAMRDIPGANHSWEHLATTDRGVVMLRRIWGRQVDKVLRGEDPIGVSYDADEAPRQTVAGFHFDGVPEGAGAA